MPTIFLRLTNILNGKTANTSISTTPPRFEFLLQETPSNICKRLILPGTRLIDLHFCRWQYGSMFIRFHAIVFESRTSWV